MPNQNRNENRNKNRNENENGNENGNGNGNGNGNTNRNGNPESEIKNRNSRIHNAFPTCPANPISAMPVSVSRTRRAIGRDQNDRIACSPSTHVL